MKRLIILPLVLIALLLMGNDCAETPPVERSEADRQLTLCNRIPRAWLEADEVEPYMACLNNWVEKYGGDQ